MKIRFINFALGLWIGFTGAAQPMPPTPGAANETKSGLTSNGPAPSGESEGDEPLPYAPLAYQNTDGFWLEIEIFDDSNSKRISLNNITNALVYDIDVSTNLVNWSLYQRIVATDTNFSFVEPPDETMRFFRAKQLDNRIQFPDWDDGIEQFLFFDAWTPVTGTYHLELYGDGALVFQTTQTIPTNGFFGVRDGSYNPNDWPNTGYYAVEQWELVATVTPANTSAVPASVSVKKQFRHPYQSRRGITVHQHKVLGEPVSSVALDEFLSYIHLYYLGNLQTTPQINVNGSPVDEFLDTSMLPKLYEPWHWTNNLIGFITNRTISDLYYFGHGNNTYIGSAPPYRIALPTLQASSMLKTNPMRYVGLDGCNTAKETDMLNAYVGYKKSVTRPWFRDKGFIPRFGWGMKEKKAVADYLRGSLYDPAFAYVVDFYQHLTHRDASGFFDNTYKDSVEFARHPQGRGFNYPPYGQPQYNEWAVGPIGFSFNPFTYVGCEDCFFDE